MDKDLIGWCIRCMEWVYTNQGMCAICGASTSDKDLTDNSDEPNPDVEVNIRRCDS